MRRSIVIAERRSFPTPDVVEEDHNVFLMADRTGTELGVAELASQFSPIGVFIVMSLGRGSNLYQSSSIESILCALHEDGDLRTRHLASSTSREAGFNFNEVDLIHPIQLI